MEPSPTVSADRVPPFAMPMIPSTSISWGPRPLTSSGTGPTLYPSPSAERTFTRTIASDRQNL